MIRKIKVLGLFVLTGLIASSVFAFAQADVTKRLREGKFYREGCEADMRPLHMWMENKAGQRTDFVIPNAYIMGMDGGLTVNRKEGRTSFLAFDLPTRDFTFSAARPRPLDPACYLFDWQNDFDKDKDAVGEIEIKILPANNKKLADILEDSKKYSFPVFSGVTPEGFSIFRDKRDQDIEYNKRLANREMLVPPENYLHTPFYAICKRRYIDNKIQTRSCNLTLIIKPELHIKVKLQHKDLSRIQATYERVQEFLTRFQINNKDKNNND